MGNEVEVNVVGPESPNTGGESIEEFKGFSTLRTLRVTMLGVNCPRMEKILMIETHFIVLAYAYVSITLVRAQGTIHVHVRARLVCKFEVTTLYASSGVGLVCALEVRLCMRSGCNFMYALNVALSMCLERGFVPISVAHTWCNLNAC
ncbi:Hypothetical predicted protein [Olea europaea subsp. europaea]|uniref:Uncharacterized protein n=1 Tax=Olea europaea subsp. europaea TaxID=158383 RepID=A0A8S0TMK3_OLEEU|nr:Hypothetical predicted protein [Olea europaea subsp. europaea]